jgi:hypothetical protein
LLGTDPPTMQQKYLYQKEELKLKIQVTKPNIKDP